MEGWMDGWVIVLLQNLQWQEEENPSTFLIERRVSDVCTRPVAMVKGP